MSPELKPKTRFPWSRIRLEALCLLLIGATLGGVFAVLTVRRTFDLFLFGAADGICISLMIILYRLYRYEGFLRTSSKRYGFLVRVLVNFLVYSACFFSGSVLGRLISARNWLPVFDGQFFASVGFMLFVVLMVSFFLEMNRLLGPRVLLNFVRGNYRQPVEEDRIFLFVDLANSTALAEKLGNARYMAFLNQFFQRLALASMATDAEIYKYIGDEAILTWKNTPADMDLSAARCFFLFDQYIQESKDEFLKTYGVVPQFRGAIHEGVVIVGELGKEKLEIAFIGDVVNSTARLMDLARDGDHQLVASEHFLKEVASGEALLIPDVGTVKLKALGVFRLRGKIKQTRAYALERQDISI
ncbi:MAG: adenylate/guanylate cyclase domain-containing protein [Bdellovibrionales bacterium]|nr:adenylate/guanylate cyclase domain-containing protein [Bdellovibrionales bacterium]